MAKATTTTAKKSKKADRFALSKEIDPARDNSAREALVTARVKMILSQPFWGKLASQLELVNADAWCTTCAVDGRHFFYNTNFVLSLSVSECIFVFAHEILHCAYDHLGRAYGRNRELCNVAMDYVINAELTHHNIGQPPKIDILNDPKYLNRYWEEVYDELLQEIEKNQNTQSIEDLIDKLLDDHLSKAGSDGDDGDEDENRGSGSGRPTLDPDALDEFREEFRDRIIQAAYGVNPGDLPGGVKRLIDQINEPKVDWRTLIQQRVQSIVKNDYSYATFNKKYMQSGIIVPGMRKEEAIDVAIAVDTSGSISHDQLRDVISEVVGIMDMFEDFTLRIWQFDTNVYGYAEFSKDSANVILTYDIKGGGGTSFNVNWTFMKQEEIEPKLLIFFTDGETGDGWGDPNYCDVVWIINNSYRREGVKAPYGITVNYSDC